MRRRNAWSSAAVLVVLAGAMVVHRCERRACEWCQPASRARSRGGRQALEGSRAPRLSASDLESFGGIGSTGGAGPAQRTDFTGLFSRSAGGVFLLGGIAPNGEPLHDIWFARIGEGWSERRFTDGTVLGEVRAATYSFRDESLWVLDVVPNGSHDELRLLRMDPTAGPVDKIASWRLKKKHTRHYLTVDRDGGILMTTVGPKKRGFSVARIAAEEKPGGPLVVSLKLKMKGDLALPPVVSPVSYAFVLRQRDGTARITRFPALPPAHRCRFEDLDDDDDDDKRF
jgi:hypothetical protein